MRYYCDTRLNAQTLLTLVLHYCGTYHVGYRYLPTALHWTVHSKRTNQGGLNSRSKGSDLLAENSRSSAKGDGSWSDTYVKTR
jgi:hypothetical protein